MPVARRDGHYRLPRRTAITAYPTATPRLSFKRGQFVVSPIDGAGNGAI